MSHADATLYFQLVLLENFWYEKSGEKESVHISLLRRRHIPHAYSFVKNEK